MKFMGINWESKITKYLIFLFIICNLILVNIVTVSLVERFSLKLDMTDNKLYELSETSHELAKSIEEPVKITIFNKESDFIIMLKEIINKYASLSEKITISYIDPYENPIIIDSYKQKGLNIEENDILVEGKNRSKKYNIQDLYVFDENKTKVKSVKVEQQISSAILYVNNTTIPVVKFTDGHNERPTNSLMDIFDENNYDVSRVTLGAQNLDDNIDILLIASPTRDFDSKEIESIENYLKNGGNLMVFIEPGVVELSNLEGLLNKWGIGLGKELIFEKEAFVSNNPINIVPMYAPHLINKYFSENRYFLVSPSTRNIYKLNNVAAELDVSTVLMSSPNSYGKAISNYINSDKAPEDLDGPFSLAMTSVKRGASQDQIQGRLFVVGSRNIYSDDLLNASNFANREFLIQAMNWMSENQVNMNIPAKNIEPSPINIITKDAFIIGIVLIIILPLMVFILGLIIYLRRRRL